MQIFFHLFLDLVVVLAFALGICCVHSDVSLVGLRNESLRFVVLTAGELPFPHFPPISPSSLSPLCQQYILAARSVGAVVKFVLQFVGNGL